MKLASGTKSELENHSTSLILNSHLPKLFIQMFENHTTLVK